MQMQLQTIEEIRGLFELWVLNNERIASIFLERTSGNPGILRDYKDELVETYWRGFKSGYTLGGTKK